MSHKQYKNNSTMFVKKDKKILHEKGITNINT
jgi:hypothetical protein